MFRRILQIFYIKVVSRIIDAAGDRIEDVTFCVQDNKGDNVKIPAMEILIVRN